jgi:hypothetical protein
MTNWTKLLAALHERQPWDEEFAAEIESKIKEMCSAVPVHVHKPDEAELALERAVREAVVICYQAEYSDAWFPIVVKRKWPIADCIIEGDEALIRYSISPEIDALLGGNQRPRIRIKIRKAPPTIYQRAAKGIGAMLRREPKVRPELELTQAAPPRVIDRDLAPTGYPSGETRKPAPGPLPQPKRGYREMVSAATPKPPAQKPRPGSQRK